MSSNNNLRIIIAGGGTGGHIFPAVAIANAIKKLRPNAQFLFIGAKGKMEMEKVPQAGFDIKGIDIAGFNRSAIWKNVGLPFKIINSFIQVRNIFKHFVPDAVIGVGGYSTYPVLRFAQSKSIPTFIHESNSFAGKANILLAKKVTAAYVVGSGMEKFFPAHKIKITGNPVRENLVQPVENKSEALQFFGLNTNKKTVLSIGGSLGAKSINETIANNLQFFEQNDVQLIWQTGKLFAEQAKGLCTNLKNVYTSDFIKEMHYAYTAADLVISRAGAMAIAELCTLAKPAILVPYPFAAEDHQTANALYLVNQEAALMVTDNAVQQDLFVKLSGLLKDEYHQKTMAENIKKNATPDAAFTIANDILNTIHK
jgi:UDP-N-acetylglucosamine--N-acetylmuramyl-(pentapeptide) pyrophosphoryl-undecaprenol N-acetylglucosamine transferase